MMITFSTWLTLLRIFLSPWIMVTIFRKAWLSAAVIFCCAALTDFLDGYYARLYNQQTLLGKILDPIADKILIFVTLISLACVAGVAIPWWFVAVVIVKDFILCSAGLFLIIKHHSSMIEPGWLGKTTTALLLCFFLYVILACAGYVPLRYVEQLLWFFTGCTILTLFDYSYLLYQKLRG